MTLVKGCRFPAFSPTRSLWCWAFWVPQFFLERQPQRVREMEKFCHREPFWRGTTLLLSTGSCVSGKLFLSSTTVVEAREKASGGRLSGGVTSKASGCVCQLRHPSLHTPHWSFLRALSPTFFSVLAYFALERDMEDGKRRKES